MLHGHEPHSIGEKGARAETTALGRNVQRQWGKHATCVALEVRGEEVQTLPTVNYSGDSRLNL